jgi:hypothetical protein
MRSLRTVGARRPGDRPRAAHRRAVTQPPMASGSLPPKPTRGICGRHPTRCRACGAGRPHTRTGRPVSPRCHGSWLPRARSRSGSPSARGARAAGALFARGPPTRAGRGRAKRPSSSRSWRSTCISPRSALLAWLTTGCPCSTHSQVGVQRGVRRKTSKRAAGTRRRRAISTQPRSARWEAVHQRRGRRPTVRR